MTKAFGPGDSNRIENSNISSQQPHLKWSRNRSRKRKRFLYSFNIIIRRITLWKIKNVDSLPNQDFSMHPITDFLFQRLLSHLIKHYFLSLNSLCVKPTRTNIYGRIVYLFNISILFENLLIRFLQPCFKYTIVFHDLIWM